MIGITAVQRLMHDHRVSACHSPSGGWSVQRSTVANAPGPGWTDWLPWRFVRCCLVPVQAQEVRHGVVATGCGRMTPQPTPRRRHDRVACCVDAFSSRLKAAACVQAVHELYDVAEGPQWTDGEERCSRVVVIGRRLDRAQLEQSLRQACLPGKA